MVQYGDELELGVEYGHLLFSHCGIDQLGEFNDRRWALIEQPSIEPSPGAWPAIGDSILGTLRLTEADRIEYMVDGEVVAVYGPTDEEPPGCA